MTRMGSLIGPNYGQTVTADDLDRFIEMTLGMYGAAGYELMLGFGPEEEAGAVDVKLTVKINSPDAFLGWEGEQYAVETDRPIPEHIEVDMGSEVDRVTSFKVQDNNGAVIELPRHRMTVSRETALAAVREYIATGTRPKGLDWLPQRTR